jgi:hypothetical protein
LFLLLALALAGCAGGGGDGGEDDAVGKEDNTVIVTEENSPPVLQALEDQRGPEGRELTFTAAATDPDPEETLQFSLDTDAPPGATIDPSTGEFSWMPTAAGTFTVTVRVTDAGGLSDTTTLTLIVTEVNNPPLLAALQDQRGPEGTALTFTATATDPDSGDTLRFSLDAGAATGATIDPTTGEFSWMPTAAGTFTVTVRVTDAGGLSDTAVLTLTVTQRTVTEVNNPPLLAALQDQRGPEGTALTFTATATDPDSGDTLRFSLDAGAPSGATIDATTGVFRWTPTEAQGPGTFPLTVRVTDAGGRSDTKKLTLTVSEVNRSPVLNTIGAQRGPEGIALTFVAAATDPDRPANSLTFSLDAGAPKDATIDTRSGAFRWIPPATGTFTVKVRVTDTGGSSDSETVTITVTERSFLVNNTGNQPDAKPGDGRCETTAGKGQCTLRAAIQEANALPGKDLINVPSGTYRLTTVDNDTDGKNGLPSVSSVMTIKGAGADTTSIKRDGDANAPTFRIFHIAASGSLTLDGITIAGGAVTDDSGGGLLNAGMLTLVKSTVRNNTTFFTDAAFIADGGGIFNSGTLALLNSSVRENASGSDLFANGGGIFSSGTLTLTNSSVSDNVAGYGGGIANRGKATLLNSTISANGAPYYGGGIANTGTLTLTNSTVSDNVGLDYGGGISNSNTGTLLLINSTVSDNGAPSYGGGIDNGGVLTLKNSTVSDNESVLEGGGIRNFNGGTGELSHTIVAGNRAGTGSDCSGTLTSQGHNLVGAESGCPSDSTGDQTVDPLVVFTTVLGPLQPNGGPTETHALLPDSLAIDAGGTACSSTTDQRGVQRPRDGDGDGTPVCDIGAFEFEP